MKCYNCDEVMVELSNECPYCHARINKEDYNLVKTSKILNKITNVKEFARFIGLPYLKPVILLISAIICGMIAVFFFTRPASFTTESSTFLVKERIYYMIFTFIGILAFSFYLQFKKVDKFYHDFLAGDNHYFINFPLKAIVRSFICDAHEEIVTASLMKKRINYYDKRDKDVRLLHMNSHKFLHPQKVKLFNTKEKFYRRHFSANAQHVLKTYNADDESMLVVEGVIHGFLMTKSGVISIYNTPSITKKYFKDPTILDVEIEDKNKKINS
ncbi:MAG: hypothetical protein LBT75_03630 [Bacilli bacterium]|jgi:hypothetical protein|nr:hypothetical protein [Bacilli bacterium]